MGKRAHKVLCLMLLSGPAFAEPKSITVNVSAVAEWSDNATREALENEKISDREDIVSLNLGAFKKSDWLFLSSNYHAMQESYLHDSQDSYQRIEGLTNIFIGDVNQSLGLHLSHVRASFLNNPIDLDLNKNREERTVVAVEPQYKLQLGDANSILLKASAMEASYRDAENRGAKRGGVEVTWDRGLSKVDSIQLIAQKNATKFDASPESDYQYENLSIRYETNLSRLHYTFQVGVNRAVSDLSKESRSYPTYNLVINYKSGNNNFNLSSVKHIDDTSFGGRQQESSGDFAESLAQGFDLINQQMSELSWSTKAVCERCELSLRVNQRKEDYSSLIENNYQELGGGVKFTYKVNRAMSLSLDANKREHSFENRAASNNFQLTRYRFALNYNLLNDLKLMIYVRQEKRDSDTILAEYKENITGLSLSYSF